MTRIAILTPTMMRGDAVGNDVLGMYEALRKRGEDVRIYAESWTLTEPKVWSAFEITRFLKDPADLLIYHYSMGWEIGLDLLRAPKFKTAIKYHNVTPAEFFKGISRSHESMCREGRAQLKTLARAGCDLYLSASEYNMRELLAEGADESKSFVVPPFHHIDHLDAIQPDLSVLDAHRDGKTNILMVGRISPNKGHVALIEAFATYYYNYNANSRLVIVGKEEESFNEYSSLLRRIVAGLELEDAVIFTGGVSEAALKAYYMAAHVFMITSEHEGFCVPLVEAMAMKVPIVARASTAIPDTVGRAGLVWKESNPYLLAESIDFLVRDESLGAAFGAMGWQRYAQNFTNEEIEATFLQALSNLG